MAPPIYAEPPVYAPALVSFVGFGVGVGVGVGVGIGGGIGVGIGAAIGGSVGWCPLGWNEPYRPWADNNNNPAYVRNINRTYVRNVNNITTINHNHLTLNTYANRGATTVVPAATMAASRPVAPAVQRLSPQQVADLRATPTVPVRPTATATAGVTPTVARQLNLPPAAPGATPRPAMPGPAIAPDSGCGSPRRRGGAPRASDRRAPRRRHRRSGNPGPWRCRRTRRAAPGRCGRNRPGRDRPGCDGPGPPARRSPRPPRAPASSAPCPVLRPEP